MAEGSFKTILFGLILFTLFTWLVLTVTIDFGAEYGMSSEEIGGGSFNVSDFEDSINSVEGNASGYRQRFEGGEVDDVDDASGLFSIVTDMINLITAPFKLLSQILANIFNLHILVMNVILGLVAISLILGIWRILRAGS